KRCFLFVFHTSKTATTGVRILNFLKLTKVDPPFGGSVVKSNVIGDYNPVATVLLPRSATSLSRRFNSLNRPTGFKAPPARLRASATNGRTSVRKASCKISCARTTSFCRSGKQQSAKEHDPNKIALANKAVNEASRVAVVTETTTFPVSIINFALVTVPSHQRATENYDHISTLLLPDVIRLSAQMKN